MLKPQNSSQLSQIVPVKWLFLLPLLKKMV